MSTTVHGTHNSNLAVIHKFFKDFLSLTHVLGEGVHSLSALLSAVFTFKLLLYVSPTLNQCTI